MWHLRSNYKRSFLWLLVSPRKSLQAHLLKLNLFLEPPITWKNQQFTPPGLPANFLFFGLTYAMPQVFRCAIVGGVLRYCRCNRDGCYFGCWLIRFQRSFLLLTFYKPLQLVVFFFFAWQFYMQSQRGISGASKCDCLGLQWSMIPCRVRFEEVVAARIPLAE